MKVRVRACNAKRQLYPKSWGRADFHGEPETEVEVPQEVLVLIKAGGWLIDESLVPEPTPPEVPSLPPVPDRLLVNHDPEEP